MSTPWEREGVSNNAEKSVQEEGGCFAASRHHFQCGLWKKEGAERSFYHPLLALRTEK